MVSFWQWLIGVGGSWLAVAVYMWLAWRRNKRLQRENRAFKEMVYAMTWILVANLPEPPPEHVERVMKGVREAQAKQAFQRVMKEEGK